MSLLGNIFSRKPKEPEYPVVADFSGVKTDIHSHLIPGIDDGVKSVEESLEMLRAFSTLGYKKIITTPHVMSDYFKNTPDIILSGLGTMREALDKAGIDIQMDAAAEYYLDEYFVQKLKKEKSLLTIKEKYLLFEISYINPPDYLLNVVFDINVAGFTPLLAHPERYNFWYGKLDEYKKIKDAGALFQLNVNSLTGYYGVAAKKTAEVLIDENMIDFIGSDLHGARHMDSLHHVIHEKHFRKLMALGVKNNTI
jgi:protein-tyrosine phosphatase